jgi:flavodoxin
MTAREVRRSRTLLVVSSYHHGNTMLLARAMAEAIGADILAPEAASPELLRDYDLVGLGGGIDSGRHYRPLLEFAERLPKVDGRPAFIFSTCGTPASLAPGDMLRRQVESNHAALRALLAERGYRVVGEHGCVGFNTNSFLRFFGGLNRGRPNADDLEEARAFARGLPEALAEAGAVPLPRALSGPCP